MAPISSTEHDLIGATGLALALFARLLERPEPVPRAEVAEYLALLADGASEERPGQKAILEIWAQLMASDPVANEP